MSLNLLLLDDHKVFSESLKHLFESQGFEVFNITNPIMAFGVLKTQKIDVVISDIEMPEMNGVDFVKMIKDNASILIKEPKIIILTSYRKVNLFKKLLAINIDAFLSKNVSHVELLSVITKVMEGEKYYEATIYNEYLELNKNSELLDFTLENWMF